jgi:hypothetical protein
MASPSAPAGYPAIRRAVTSTTWLPAWQQAAVLICPFLASASLFQFRWGFATDPTPACAGYGLSDHVARSAIRSGMKCFSATHDNHFSLRGWLRYRLTDCWIGLTYRPD